MAFDGIAVAAVGAELSKYLDSARLYKIAQISQDELLISFKTAEDLGKGRQLKLLISVSAQLPMIRFTNEMRQAPLNAPAFCMLLRKYLENGRVVSITRPSLERVVRIAISHYDEMGDLKEYTLVVELMGKHSNIILIDENSIILDSIKHISSSVSSVREVLPGRTYFLPDTRNKRNPLEIRDVVTFTDIIRSFPSENIHEAIYQRFTGISPVISAEICHRAKVFASSHIDALSYDQLKALCRAFIEIMSAVINKEFVPCVYYEGKKAVEFSAIPLSSYKDIVQKDDSVGACKYREEIFEDMSLLLQTFYKQKSVQSRIRNKSADLRQLVGTILARTSRKYDQQLIQLKDTEKRDIYRLRGELITAYAHEIKEGSKEAAVIDYNSGKEIKITLDPELGANENAQKFFERYARMKRTYETLSVLTKEVKEDLDQLESIRMALDLASTEEELNEIRAELVESGYLKSKNNAKTAVSRKSGKKNKSDGKSVKNGTKLLSSKPLHYVTSDGFDVYVGKNNFQNDQLTFHSQGKDDWWFHAKGVAGSHVILKAAGKEVSDKAYEEAAALAAHYSSAGNSSKVEIDYTERKNIKKPAGSKPGFVVYYTNYSMVALTDISELTLTED